MKTNTRSRWAAMTFAVAAMAALACPGLLTDQAYAQQSAHVGFPVWGPGSFDQAANARPVASRIGQSPHQAFPSFDSATQMARVVPGELLPARCSGAIEETAASLPPGFDDGSLQGQYAESVRRHFAGELSDNPARFAALR